MLRTRNLQLYSMVALLVAVVLCVGTAWAQLPDDVYFVNYYVGANTTGNADGRVRIDNPGVNNGADICADIYVFDNTEEMVECCGCNLTPDDLKVFSINRDLTSNATETVHSGVLKIVSAQQNPTATRLCDPTGGNKKGINVDNIVPAPDIRAWATHIQNPYTTRKGYVFTEEEFQDATLTTAELNTLQETCFNLQNAGTGRGVCSCGTGLD
ncbi:MAG TPA: hypothetical protein VFA89_08905 [Terriglobales bacterium]|nr:hypothetical protein [Terriglobales bacterium]